VEAGSGGDQSTGDALLVTFPALLPAPTMEHSPSALPALMNFSSAISVVTQSGVAADATQKAEMPSTNAFAPPIHQRNPSDGRPLFHPFMVTQVKLEVGSGVNVCIL